MKTAGSSPWFYTWCPRACGSLELVLFGSFWVPWGQPPVFPPLGMLTASPQSRALSVPFKITLDWDFPGAPVVKTSPSNARGVGSIPNWGAKTPHALQPTNQNMKQKPYCNKLIKILRMVHVFLKKLFFFLR